MSRPIRIVFVCLGNICRSPLAEGICRALAESRGVGHRVVVDSAGTSGEHEGEAPNPSSIRVAAAHGIDIRAQRSRRLRVADLQSFDVVVAMDRSNLRNIERLGPVPADRLVLMRDFEPDASNQEVPDPWSYGPAAFQEVYEILARAMPAFLDYALKMGPRHD